MNILFLTLCDFQSFNDRNIYCDLLREFIKYGHEVYCISPTERRNGIKTHFKEDGKMLKLKIGNTQKTNIIEKGISTLLIESQVVWALKKYFPNVKFDILMYSTPPITLASAVQYIKRRDNAKSYLLLKDIFPQNAVDIGMMSKSGVKGLLYRYFRNKEKKLYTISDRIGCMSQANVNYVLKHNLEIDPSKVEICPNSIEVRDMSISEEERIAIRKKYNIPVDKVVFVYGGNLGKPQDVRFIVKCLKACSNLENSYFLIAGSGTDRYVLEDYIKEEHPEYVKLLGQIPKDEYDKMIACCDVGLIFLDHRFTIPNFPSRLLSYMQAKLPVLACTDPNTDVGNIIEEGCFGWWCESDNVESFKNKVICALDADYVSKGSNALQYLYNHYESSQCCEIIVEKFDT